MSKFCNDEIEVDELCCDNGFVIGRFVDPSTGVHYLVARGPVGDSGVAITPRLTSDGKLFVTYPK